MSTAVLGGNPDIKQATFSRFVLPFAYQLVAANLPRLHAAAAASARAQNAWSWSHLAYWRRIGLEDSPWGGASPVTPRERMAYFTAETGAVLFTGRTARFRLDCADKAIGPETVRADGVNALLAPPELILFEFDPRERSKGSPLHMGLLVLSVHFSVQSINSFDLYKFNECFRNLREPYAGYRPGPVDVSAVSWLERLGDRDSEATPTADAPYQRLWLGALDAPIDLNGYEPCFLYSDRAAAMARSSEYDLSGELMSPMIHADYRAHTWSAIVSPHGAADLQGPAQAEAVVSDPIESSGWLRLLNVDSPGPDPDADSVNVKSQFVKTWLQHHTYQRWAPGSLYGFTPHSGAAWLPDTSKWSDPLKVHQHFHTLYFDQLTLMLYLRSVLFGFSREISALSRRIQQKSTSGSHEFALLEREFSVFTNLYQFPLLSHQQQAIEIYAKLRDSLDVQEFYMEVQDEVRHMAAIFDRRHDHLIRNVGVSFAVLAMTGLLWDDLGVKEWVVNGTQPHGTIIIFVLLVVAFSIWRLRRS